MLKGPCQVVKTFFHVVQQDFRILGLFLRIISYPPKTEWKFLPIFATIFVLIFPKFPLFWRQSFQILPQKWCQHFQNGHNFGINITMLSIKFECWNQNSSNFGNVDTVSVVAFGNTDTKSVERSYSVIADGGSMAHWCRQRFIGGNSDLNLLPGTKEKQHHWDFFLKSLLLRIFSSLLFFLNYL